MMQLTLPTLQMVAGMDPLPGPHKPRARFAAEDDVSSEDIPLLVSALVHKDKVLLQNSLAALVRLVDGCSANQMAVADLGGIPRLVELATSPSTGQVQVLSLLVLGSLTSNELLLARFREHMPGLVKMLAARPATSASGGAVGPSAAALSGRLLVNLTAGNDALQHVVVEVSDGGPHQGVLTRGGLCVRVCVRVCVCLRACVCLCVCTCACCAFCVHMALPVGGIDVSCQPPNRLTCRLEPWPCCLTSS